MRNGLKWTATVNDFELRDCHLSISEACQFIGECAHREGADALVEAIEGFIKWPILKWPIVTIVEEHDRSLTQAQMGKNSL